ncbi:MAG TPA: glycosyltransferase family 39 protein [Thermoanaerobaculia bacterium]|nr:glycosyltransferase family 39 protein [Thermoanaerobaculia bacterium]
MIVAFSLALRVVLVFSGGQGYWPDETRYLRSRVAVDLARRGAWSKAASYLSNPDHVMFPILGLAPASVDPATRIDWMILQLSGARIPAIFFSLFSVASLLLLFAIARRVGESAEASCLAALLFALSATQLYYSRHLLPYDAGLALLLGALYAGLRRPDAVRDSILCGALSCAGFLTYNGYWLLAIFAGLAHLFRPPLSRRLLVRRAAIAGAAFAAPILAIAAIDAAVNGDFFRRWVRFAGTVTQGSYGEGWRLPFAYLWHAEHLMTLLWAASLAWALARLARDGRSRSGALAVGVAGIVFVYAGLVLASVVLHETVVYGRHVRQLVPFACLISGAALGRLASRREARARLALAVVLAAACLQAALNFRPPLRQVFPDEFRRMAGRLPNPDGSPRRILYAEHIYPVPRDVVPANGVVLLARDHPLQYLPYQYEGFAPAERAALRATDIRMRLIGMPAERAGHGD